MAYGLRNQDIADKLFVSESTVKTTCIEFCKNAMPKTGLRQSFLPFETAL